MTSPFHFTESEYPRSIYVSNISPEVSGSLLESYFLFSGSILRTALALNPDDTEATQHALIIFKDSESIDKALLLNGSPLSGREISLTRCSDVFHCPDDLNAPSAPEFSSTSATVTSYLGKALFSAKQGWDVASSSIKSFDEKAGVSKSVLKFNEEHGISSAAKDVTTRAGSVVSSINNKYHISDTVSTTFNTLKTKAMDVEPINKGYNVSRTTIEGFLSGVKSSYQQHASSVPQREVEVPEQQVENVATEDDCNYPEL
ncbi:hypothetical protein GEMRC1_004124 [Eukaryota sp. GEM-RC1]